MSIVENRLETTRRGGVTGAGFVPGVSGNPGGRPKGLARRVRELVGSDGHEIVEFMFETMSNEKVRMADRLEAGKWLADRGFGKAVDMEVQSGGLDLRKVSGADLDALIGILQRAEMNSAEAIESGEVRISSAS
jgi:hypothetical protein